MDHEALFQAIKHSAIVLTPNRRLAAWFKTQFDSKQGALGQLTWPTATILPLATWLQACWENYALSSPTPLPTLLNEHQTLTLWENVVKPSIVGKSLLNVNATATAVQRSWQLSKQWQIKLTADDFAVTDEAQAFLSWAGQYQQHCADQQFIDRHAIIEHLLTAWQQQRLPPPSQIIFACFDELTPQVNHFIKELKLLGTHIHTFNQKIAPKTIQLAGLPTLDEELVAMAKWANQQLHTGAQSIACVVPQLSQLRQKVARAFLTHVTSADLFNISLGQPLSDFPIIHTALQILQLNQPFIEMDPCSFLLRSPFLGESHQEWLNRAKLQTLLQSLGYLMITRKTLCKIASETTTYAPLLAKRLQLAFNDKPLRLKQFPSHWAEYFRKQLNEMGWPGERTLNSEEYQLVNRWQTLLSEFATLDLLGHQLSLTQALSKLAQLTRRTIFQAQTTQAPIQVLGQLEAGGMQFDAMWLMGMDDHSFPPSPRPDPFIPKAIQQQTNLAHANATRELSYSRSLLDRLVHSSHKLIISYALSHEDQTRRPSPLVTELEPITTLSVPIHPPSDPQLGNQTLSQIVDELGPALSDSNSIRGGSFILQEQASCPFKAFAKFRLGAKTQTLTPIGLSRKIQGILVHRCLQNFWGKTKDWQTLQSYDDKALAHLLSISIARALQTLQAKDITLTNDLFLKVEQQRLQRLLTTWLNKVERHRPPFKVIKQEHQLEIKLAGLCLTVRIDRVDQLEDASKLIIDYKTGKTTIANWFSERPNEPQLPLYSLTQDDTMGGIAYGQIYSYELTYKGLAAGTYEIAGVKSIADNAYYLKQLPQRQLNWDSQKQTWRRILTKLADDFCKGQAAVAPKYPQQTCKFCNLQSLCRIHSQP